MGPRPVSSLAEAIDTFQQVATGLGALGAPPPPCLEESPPVPPLPRGYTPSGGYTPRGYTPSGPQEPPPPPLRTCRLGPPAPSRSLRSGALVQEMKDTLARLPKEDRRGAGGSEPGGKAVSSLDTLDSLLADMETFRANKLDSKPGSRKVEIEITNTKHEEELERKLEGLTDLLKDSLKPGAVGGAPAPGAREDLGQCAGCRKKIQESAVLAGGDTFHQDCFTCSHCGQGLGEQFFVVGGKNYCPQHQTVALDCCAACSQPIRESSVLANKQPYHPHCFSCSTCRRPIGGRFFTQPDGSFLCELDYQASREKCSHCRLPLLERVLSAVDKKFHPACFRCALCDCALEGVPFLVSSGSVNCQPCYTKYKAAQCVRCSQGIVSSGQKKAGLVTCQGRSYHESCYTCHDCGAGLTGQFVCAAEEEIVCFTCDTRRRGARG